MNCNEIINKGVPKHIAIILDGNGRWANKRGMPRIYGHQQGIKTLEKIAKLCNEIGVECLTVFAFSTENWNRPQEEVEFLMSAPAKYFKNFGDKNSNEDGIVINFIGRKDRIPQKTLSIINEITNKTKDNRGMKLNIAFDYGSKDELITATKKIAKSVKNGDLSVDEINDSLIEKYLFTYGDPELDLLIRTSGEQRISNFMLWQLSYAELYFSTCYWPDFDKKELFKAIESYQNRNRRYGKIDKGDSK